MLARIALFFLLAVIAEKTYILDETTNIFMTPGETVRIDFHPLPEKSKNIWVIGRFPSNRIIPNEGRLGDRYQERIGKHGQIVQTWTIVNIGGKIGDVYSMDFWYLNPQYAEQYYNDPAAYEEMHEEKVLTRIMNFTLVSKDL